MPTSSQEIERERRIRKGLPPEKEPDHDEDEDEALRRFLRPIVERHPNAQIGKVKK